MGAYFLRMREELEQMGGICISGDVEVLGLPAEQKISDAAPNQIRLITRGMQTMNDRFSYVSLGHILYCGPSMWVTHSRSGNTRHDSNPKQRDHYDDNPVRGHICHMGSISNSYNEQREAQQIQTKRHLDVLPVPCMSNFEANSTVTVNIAKNSCENRVFS